MIFRRALLRELTTTAVGVFVVLLAIAFTRQLVRYLGLAAGGTVATDAVGALLGFAAIYYLPLLISVTLFLSVLLTLTRTYRDSEMVVWQTSGVGLTAWLGPIALFAVPLIVTLGVLSLALSPWAESKAVEFRRILESRNEAAALAPGLFKEARGGEAVYFIESFDTLSNRINNVFLQTVEQDKLTLTVAQAGYLDQRPSGEVYLVLEKGRRYQGDPGSAEFRTADFERFGQRIESREVSEEPLSSRAQDTLTLLRERQPEQVGELFWRFSMPVSTLLMVALAVPLGYVNPRVGRSFNLVLAVLVYMVFYNWTSIVQSLIAQGRLWAPLGGLATHGVLAVAVVALFRRRIGVPAARRAS